jgi:serine protease Do
VGPSVVNIKTLEKVSVRGNGQDSPEDQDMQELFRRFFGVPFPNVPGAGPNAPRQPRKSPNAPPAQPSEEELTKGVGSGFILSADGLIMTNAHVVEGADQVLVTLTDKREFKAKIIGVDKRTDVALLKVEASGLPAVKIGDVSRLKVGEWVMAIGSPFGLENTVTAGIVSAKKRDTGDYLSFIQTDVAINPGNSGGPLLNMRGEVVGINSQIYSRSGGFMGISFAIPIDEAIRVSDQLRTLGRVQRGKLGIQIEQVASVDNFHDLDGLASLIQVCDEVVCVDNATVHLSAVIGKKTQVLLPFHPDWRWGLSSGKSIWYPGLELLRQAVPGDWSSVLQALRNKSC